MAIESISQIADATILEALRRRDVSLWILPGAGHDDVRSLVGLPWTNVWDAAPELDANDLWASSTDGRRPLRISRPEQDHATFRGSEFVRVYDVAPPGVRDLRRERFIDRLKDRVEEVTGLLCFIGDANGHADDITLARELAPGIPILLIAAADQPVRDTLEGEFFVWTDGADAFAVSCGAVTDAAGDPLSADLLGVPGLKVDERLLEDISTYWTFLSSMLTTPSAHVAQDQFDAFLNGGEEWGVYAADAPYAREGVLQSPTDSTVRLDLAEEVARNAEELQEAKLDPDEQLRQMLIFCESGSGVTTLLRRSAMRLARAGMPVLIAKPFARTFGGRSLENFIIDLQNRWLNSRGDAEAGSRLIPVCLFIDTDGESVQGEVGLARSLQALGRRVLLVRAMERSVDEIEEATGVYVMRSEVDSDELVALGAHLRAFCEKEHLARIPADSEWRAFHEGLSRLHRYTPALADGTDFHTPPLFLIGLYPFLKERVSDENSLEQYYYRKWSELGDENAKEIVRVLATAGAYGLSVPFDTLRRHPDIDVLQLNSLDRETRRTLDIFVKWDRSGHSTGAWYLHMRHTAIAMLLSHTIDPSEGDFPYRAILPLLRNLATKEEDLWFAGTIAYRLGRHFRGRTRFSLDTDTAVQRAARAVFDAIPRSVKAVSRTIQHHQGRYHLHILRTCDECLRDPKLTTLTPDEVEEIAIAEFEKATEYLTQAVAVKGDGEPVSNIFNTLGHAHFSLSDILRRRRPDRVRDVIRKALDYQDLAIKHDPANGIALFQFVQRIHKTVGEGDGDLDLRLSFLARAELRLAELMRLHEEKRWRNVDPIEAEKTIGTLVQDHVSAVRRIVGDGPATLDFEAVNPEAAVFLQVRLLVEHRSLEEAFRHRPTASMLRKLRDRLEDLPARSTPSDIYLYRLFLADPEGRLSFETRLDILHKIQREDPEQFVQFRHDEATLFCQVDQLDIGAARLRDLREYRRFDRAQWFWNNERALLDGDRPRELVLEVVDSVGGWAFIRGTDIRVKYQPYQFGEMTRRHVFRAFIRFTLNGLQAVSESLVQRDMREMGLLR